MNREDIIRMAREAGIDWSGKSTESVLVRAMQVAYAAGAAAERERADALAATINALRDIVTTDHETKAHFIARVRSLLGDCPDTRVLHAVAAEREACAMAVWRVSGIGLDDQRKAIAAIRARSKQ